MNVPNSYQKMRRKPRGEMLITLFTLMTPMKVKKKIYRYKYIVTIVHLKSVNKLWKNITRSALTL
jgi:hypothetical protein